MSTQLPRTQPVPASPAPTEVEEIRIVSHSNLFYWWPVWAVGFILALLTYLDGHRLVIVPNHSQAESGRTVKDREDLGARDILILPPGTQFEQDPETKAPISPHYRIAANKSYGVLYAIVLLLLIVITNTPLRGLWSVVVIIIIILGSIILAEADLWGPILHKLGQLHIYINAAGYLLISLALFVIWLVTFLLFDQQIYMVFTPGQLRVRQEIGGGELAYDTQGMVIQKQRNDLFRHWILGLGSGDLIVTTSGAATHHFDLPNVLFVGHKVRMIEDMLREKPVVQGAR